jgi:hypothetical protein
MATAEFLETEIEIDEVVNIEDDMSDTDFVRRELVRRLNRITDIDALRKITNYLAELKLPEDVYVLTPEEEQMIAEAEAELDAGLGIPDEIVRKETLEWLLQLQKIYG